MTEQQEERLVAAVERAATALVRLADAAEDRDAVTTPSDQAVAAIIEQNRMMVQALFQGILQWVEMQAKKVQAP